MNSFFFRLHIAYKVFCNPSAYTQTSLIPVAKTNQENLHYFLGGSGLHEPNEALIDLDELALLIEKDNSFFHANETMLEITKLQVGDFPIIQEGKIKNTDFVAVKKKYIDLAFDSVREYYEYLIHLPPIARQKNFSGAIAYIIRGFISIYWDMPSSKEHHDSMPFGQLRHSLLVACQEAEQASRLNIYGKSGIDSEQTRKQRPFIVTAAFIAGLFHDSNKILNYRLQCSLSTETKHYSPFYGSSSILEFYLKYPRNRIRAEWKQNDYPNFNYGLHLFYAIVPKALRKVLSGELYEFIYTSISFYKGSADQIATSLSLQENDYLGKVIACCHELAMQSTTINHPKGWAFKLCSDWYIVKHKMFINDLAHRMQAVAESLEKVLYESGILFGAGSSANPSYVFDLYVYLPNQKQADKMNVSFITAPFFDKILAATSTPDAVSNYGIKLLENNKTYIEAIGLEPTLPQYVYKVIEKDIRAQQAAESQPLPEAYKKPSPPEEVSSQADFGPHLPPPEKEPELPENAPKTTAMPTMQEERKKEPVATPGANKPPLQNLTVSEKALHQALHKRISPEFMSAAPHVATAVLQAIANAWGISNGKVISEYHLQRLQDERTVFYILENRTLIARHPHVIKLGWELFQNEIAQGMHVWSADIPDLPKAFTGIDLIGSKLMKYIYSNWADMGCLVPREKSIIFRESQCAVTLITGYRKGEPQRLNAFVHGDFIELNPDAFRRMVTCRQGKNTCDEALQHTFFASYNRSWTGTNTPSGETT